MTTFFRRWQSVYWTLPKFETLAKCVPQKRCVRTVRSFQKETEGFGRLSWGGR